MMSGRYCPGAPAFGLPSIWVTWVVSIQIHRWLTTPQEDDHYEHRKENQERSQICIFCPLWVAGPNPPSSLILTARERRFSSHVMLLYSRGKHPSQWADRIQVQLLHPQPCEYKDSIRPVKISNTFLRQAAMFCHAISATSISQTTGIVMSVTTWLIVGDPETWAKVPEYLLLHSFEISNCFFSSQLQAFMVWPSPHSRVGLLSLFYHLLCIYRETTPSQNQKISMSKMPEWKGRDGGRRGRRKAWLMFEGQVVSSF